MNVFAIFIEKLASYLAFDFDTLVKFPVAGYFLHGFLELAKFFPPLIHLPVWGLLIYYLRAAAANVFQGRECYE